MTAPPAEGVAAGATGAAGDPAAAASLTVSASMTKVITKHPALESTPARAANTDCRSTLALGNFTAKDCTRLSKRVEHELSLQFPLVPDRTELNDDVSAAPTAAAHRDARKRQFCL